MVELQKKYKIGVRHFGLINYIGLIALYYRECSRFFVVWAQTLLSPLVSSLIFLESSPTFIFPGFGVYPAAINIFSLVSSISAFSYAANIFYCCATNDFRAFQCFYVGLLFSV